MIEGVQVAVPLSAFGQPVWSEINGELENERALP